MPRQIYPGEFKFHIFKSKGDVNQAKLAKRRTDTQKRMAKLRENQSRQQIVAINKLQAERQNNQRQQDINNNILVEQLSNLGIRKVQ